MDRAELERRGWVYRAPYWYHPAIGIEASDAPGDCEQYADARVRAALEEAAKIADSHEDVPLPRFTGGKTSAQFLAERIRALKPPEDAS